ncbi:recombinase family protein [Halalkalibacter urbisdiaboli]|uniref:recombinase family protein n=1 Tax=Halalkalibacter urbisdiaboli TaxID=1960589 RepID=UPI000B42E589|nr:recombinase family protein [Halalkalibacter urbisdiaboli]
MIYGYARVSSTDQNLDRQIKSLLDANCEKIFEEKISGANRDRPELNNMLNQLKEGDTIIVHSLNRISRSTIDLLQLVDELKQKKVSLKSISDTWLDTTSNNPFSEFLLTVMSGLVQYERQMIKQSQLEGIAAAKIKGKYRGRPKKFNSKHPGLTHAIELYNKGDKTVKEISEITKVSKSTLYRFIHQEK